MIILYHNYSQKSIPIYEYSQNIFISLRIQLYTHFNVLLCVCKGVPLRMIGMKGMERERDYGPGGPLGVPASPETK